MGENGNEYKGKTLAETEVTDDIMKVTTKRMKLINEERSIKRKLKKISRFLSQALTKILVECPRLRRKMKPNERPVSL